MKILSIEEGIEIQKKQLIKWGLVLKKKVHKDLVLWATSTNHEAINGYGICRGNDLDNYVSNYDSYTKAKTREVKKALKLLSCDDGFEGVRKMVELIKKNKNQDELIDYIDGVQVWQKIEFQFTCKEFIELISK
jgi:hypothetical protein